MNDTILKMKTMQRAMRPYVLILYEMILESKPEFVLEIGTGQCQSARAITSALSENKKGKLISVDVGDRRSRMPVELLPYFIQIISDSHLEIALEKVKEVSPIYDFLFIDGDHTYEGVKKDFEMYVPLVKEEGIILMHDTVNHNEGVKDFWDEIKYPKVNFKYGNAANGVVPGLGIIEKITESKE